MLQVALSSGQFWHHSPDFFPGLTPSGDMRYPLPRPSPSIGQGPPRLKTVRPPNLVPLLKLQKKMARSSRHGL